MSVCRLLIVALIVAVSAPASATLTGGLATLAPEPGASEFLRQDVITLDDRQWHRTETRINSSTRSRQEYPTIGLDGEGRIWAAWQGRRQGVFGRCLDGTGRCLTNEVSLQLHHFPGQERPVTVPDLDGHGGWVIWESAGQDGDLGGLIARRFHTLLTEGSDEILVNQTTRGNQGDLAACGFGVNGLAAAWIGSENQLLFRCFDGDGRPLGNEQPVAADARTPALCTTPDQGVVLAWASAEAGIFVQPFGPDGVPAAPSQRVSRGDEGWRDVEPSLARLADNNLVVAWPAAGSDGDDYGIKARILDPGGTPRGPAFVVNDLATGLQNGPAIAADPAGGFTILWNHFDNLARTAHIRGRFFGSDGRATGSSSRLTSNADGDQRLQVAAGRVQALYTDDGVLAFCWSGDAGLGDGTGTHLTLLSPEARPAAPSETDWQHAFCRRLEEMMAGSPERTTAARPHVPPVHDPNTISKDPYGGDRSPFPVGDDGFLAFTSTGWTPPDPHLAVGPDHVVAMVNGGIAFLDKVGNNLYQNEINGSSGFWGELGSNGTVFDPEVIYDPHDQRFIAMACEDTSNNSYFLIAVSDDSNPEGDWHKYRLDTTAYADDFLDSPNMAVDADALYLSGDAWTGAANYFIYILDKTPLLSGGTAMVDNILTINGPQSHGIPVIYGDAPAMYMIEHFEQGTNTSVRLHAITDPLGSVSRVTTTVTVPAYGWPSNPPQMGTSSRPEMFDARFWHCVWRNGSLWACHHVDNPVRARWYQIATNGWPASGTPALVQSGEIDPGPAIHTFFNSISVDALGNAATCFARSASDEYISMSRATRLAADPAGTMAAPVILKDSSGPYTSGRWGDYSSVAVDPTDGTTFWAHHEYCPGGNSWNTWVAHFTAGGAAAPMIAAGPGPGQNNPPEVRLFNAAAPGSPIFSFDAYGVSQYGVNVASGDIDGDGVEEIVTGAGPGAVFGPHVRAWEYTGAEIPGVNFLAYGTNKWGVNVACGDIDGDGIDEIITGAGPGAVFGPHVRAWNYDGGSLTPIAAVSYFAYGTPKWGVNVACGDLDGDGFDEIITGAGPGSVYGPHVRGWDYDGNGVAAMSGVSFLAYGTNQFGVNATCGDLDGDGDDEIVTGPGPGVVFGAHVRGWDVSGGTTAALPGVSFVAYAGYLYGANVAAGDLDGDGMEEILTAPGPDLGYPCLVRGWNVDGGTATAITGIDFDAFSSTVTHGGNVAVVDRP